MACIFYKIHETFFDSMSLCEIDLLIKNQSIQDYTHKTPIEVRDFL
jgi:hypothetical protein